MNKNSGGKSEQQNGRTLINYLWYLLAGLSYFVPIAAIVFATVGLITTFIEGQYLSGIISTAIELLIGFAFWKLAEYFKRKARENKDESSSQNSTEDKTTQCDQSKVPTLQEQYQELKKNNWPWVRLSKFRKALKYLNRDEYPRFFMATKAGISRHDYAMITNRRVMLFNIGFLGDRHVKSVSWEEIKKVKRKTKNNRYSSILLLVKSKQWWLKKIPNSLGKKALEYIQVKVKEENLGQKLDMERVEESEIDKGNVQEIYEMLFNHRESKQLDKVEYAVQRKKQIGRIKEILWSEIRETFLERFVYKYGSGNKAQLERLAKTINKRLGYKIGIEELRELVDGYWKSTLKQAFTKAIESHNPTSRREYIEAFIQEFGKGNEQKIEFLADMLSEQSTVSHLREDIKERFKQLREEQEIKRFEEELGLTKHKTNENKGERQDLDEYTRAILGKSKEKTTSWQDIQSQEGLEFEELVADLFEAMGYDTTVTTGSGDQGCDVVAKKPFEKLIIQAKHYENKVSNSAVQEVSAALDYYDGDQAAVVTNSNFTKSAKDLAKHNDVALYNGEKLRQLVDKYLNETKL